MLEALKLRGLWARKSLISLSSNGDFFGSTVQLSLGRSQAQQLLCVAEDGWCWKDKGCDAGDGDFHSAVTFT